MSFKITKFTVGKGKTIGDEKAAEWTRRYYEIEVSIDDEHDIEMAKASVEGLIEGWLTGSSEIEPQNQSQNQQLRWDSSRIKWEQAEGTSGPYERSDDVNNLDFKNLLKDLATHKGKLIRDGVFYWAFKNGATVGRKKRK
jgi:hypothetical protein